MSESYRPRLSIEITQQQAKDLNELIPWGLKNQLFSAIVDDVIRLRREFGVNFLAVILARTMPLEDYSELGKELKKHES